MGRPVTAGRQDRPAAATLGPFHGKGSIRPGASGGQGQATIADAGWAGEGVVGGLGPVPRLCTTSSRSFFLKNLDLMHSARSLILWNAVGNLRKMRVVHGASRRVSGHFCDMCTCGYRCTVRYSRWGRHDACFHIRGRC